MNRHPDNLSDNGDGLPVDPVLDAMLEELLGAAAPPDFTAQILQRQAEARSAAVRQARADALLPPSCRSIDAATEAPSLANIPPRNGAAVAVDQNRRRRRQNERASKMYASAIAMSAIVVAASVAVIVWTRPPHGGGNPPIAENAPSSVPQQRGTGDGHRALREPMVQYERGQPGSNRTPRDSQASLPGGPPDSFARPAPFQVNGESSAPGKSDPRPYLDPLLESDVVALVNVSIDQAMAEAGVSPSAAAADSEYVRRVYLRVLGRIPSVAELTHYLGDDSPDKREKLLDLLLNGEKYSEELAENWAEFWTNVLIGRRGGMSADSLANRDGLTDFLRQSLRQRKPFSQVAYELLTAEGTNSPGAPDYNGAVNFLLDSYDENASLATNRTTRIFLGKQLQCAQCHNHHVNDWSQQQYWQVNSFFRQMRAEPAEAGLVRLVDRDFRGASGSYEEAEVFYEQVNGLGKAAYPVWLDGEAIEPSGRVADVRRRVELAQRLVASDDFAAATVNRLWDHFLGRGFTRPIDDMGPHNPPSHPELLDQLSEQFAAHDFDWRKLIRWIALTDSFSRSSRPSATNLADSADSSERPLFSRYYTRQMEAEELYDSLVMLADSRTASGGGVPSDLLAAKRDFVGQFARDMNTDEGNEIIHFDGSLQQSLSMMNGDLMDRATDVEAGNILRRVLASNDMSWGAKIEHLFLASLAREPSRRELQVADRLLQTHRGNQVAALQDLWWALLNSNEFILDH